MTERIVHIVDDDGPVRESLRWLLTSIGLEARIYDTPLDFLAGTAGRPQGCVLLDVRMPGTDGIAVLKSLARHGMTAPVIVMTGHAGHIDAAQVRRLGAVDFIEKPFVAERLLAAIESALAEPAIA